MQVYDWLWLFNSLAISALNAWMQHNSYSNDRAVSLIIVSDLTDGQLKGESNQILTQPDWPENVGK